MDTITNLIVKAINSPEGDKNRLSVLAPGTVKTIDIGKIVDSVYSRTHKSVTLSVISTVTDEMTGRAYTSLRVVVY